ncbi:MAG: efflux RND transporter permease subunit [Deltaproteobacteria bacterium]|nr:efflux RND transporter permease subunit [Deltaproteobacteria bacterium]
MTRFFVRRPILVNLLMLGLLGAGGYLYQQNIKEQLPEVQGQAAWILSLDPGVPARDMEQLVTAPLEEAVRSVTGVEKTMSRTFEGRSFILISFDPGLDNISEALLDIQARVQQAPLPQHLPIPRVERMRAVQAAMTMVLFGGDAIAEQEWVLGEVGRELKRKLSALADVGAVQSAGLRERQLQVRLDSAQLLAHKLTLGHVAQALKARRSNIPGGSFERDKEEVAVRTLSRLRSLDDLRGVVVRSDAQGEHVVLGDLATVKRGLAQAQRLAASSGQPAIVLTLQKKRGGDLLRLDRQARQVVRDLKRQLPESVELTVLGSGAQEVERGLGTLTSNGLMGIGLVVLVLWLFIGARNAVMAALGIPVAIFGTAIVMKFMGISVSNLSLFSLILCLGLVVDDAIVIVENIYRHMRAGASPAAAALSGTQEVMWPVISSTLTTLAAFLPLLLMTGMMGQFFAIIPKVVAAALLVSLVEALIFLPSHMAEFGRLKPETRSQRWQERMGRWMARYEGLLRSALRRPVIVAFSVALLAAGLVVAAVATKDVVLFAKDEIQRFDVRVRMPHGTSLKQTMALLQRIEARARALLGGDARGMVAQAGWMRTKVWPEDGNHLGMLEVFLKRPGERSRAGQQIIDVLRERLDDIAGPLSIEVQSVTFAPPVGKPVAVRITGDNLQRLGEIAGLVQHELQTVPGVVGVDHDLHSGKSQISVRLHSARAATAGLTRPELGLQLRASFAHVDLGLLRLGERSLSLALSLGLPPAAERLGPEALQLVLAGGRQVPLSELAEIQRGRALPIITRRDGKRCVTVTAELSKGQTSAGANRALARKLAAVIAANPEVEISVGGEWEETARSLESLFAAFLLAALLIYTVLSTQFRSLWQPLVVLFSVPLSLIGVVLGFFISGEPVGLIALVGVVGLAGIAVNDATLLIDFVNTRRRSGMSVVEALVAACRLRLRPVLLTTITTVAGLLPLSMGWGGSSKALEPMALAIVWGLSFSTALTLIVVPCLYLALDRARDWMAARLTTRRYDTLPEVSIEPSPPQLPRVDEGAF